MAAKEIRGIKIGCDDTGDGNALVLIHGILLPVRCGIFKRLPSVRRTFRLTPGIGYQVADNAERHKSTTKTGAKLFIID